MRFPWIATCFRRCPILRIRSWRMAKCMWGPTTAWWSTGCCRRLPGTPYLQPFSERTHPYRPLNGEERQMAGVSAMFKRWHKTSGCLARPVLQSKGLFKFPNDCRKEVMSVQ